MSGGTNLIPNVPYPSTRASIPALEGTVLSLQRDPELRSVRRLSLIAASVYFSWWFVVQATLPDSYNPLSSRLAVVACFLATLGGTFVSDVVRKHAYAVFAASAWILTSHYYYLFYKNDGSMPWAVGAYVVVVAVSACLSSRRSLFAYSALTAALAVMICVLNRTLLQTIFLPGLVTMTLLANITLRNRLLLEQERADRLRVEVEHAVTEAALAVRDEFIDIASHELRTPLTSLQLSVQRLESLARKADKEISSEFIGQTAEKCRIQIVRLNRLVDSLLDASRATDDALLLNRTDCTLRDVVQDAIDALAVDIERCGSVIELEVDAAIYVNVDRIRIEQVMVNLLRNALVFGCGQPIHVAVEEVGAKVRIVVRDSGIGIRPELQTRIFERFERGVSSRNYGGMGLGLYVVSRIVHAHNGTIRVSSEPERGATFTVELPRFHGHAPA